MCIFSEEMSKQPDEVDVTKLEGGMSEDVLTVALDHLSQLAGRQFHH